MDKKEYREKLKKPLDSTHDMKEIVNDTTGLTGITSTDNGEDKGNFPDNQTISRSMSEDEYGHALAVAEGRDEPSDRAEKYPSVKEQTKDDIRKMTDKTPPDIAGEQSESGDMPIPSSDNDVTENEKKVGLHQNEDPEHPEELDIGSEIDAAEEYHRSH